jgi:hypothetical protein
MPPLRRPIVNPATGIIIATGFVVAAGIALYESEQFRIWFDERRRQIAVAFYDIGDNIRPEMRQQMGESSDASYSRAMDIVHRNRAELIRRAREEGIAVDLDELAAITHEERPQDPRRRSNTSFDDFLTDDGKLKQEKEAEASSSAIQPESSNNLRQRGVGSRGLAAGASFANPFEDENNVLFDREDILAPSESELRGLQTPRAASIRSVSPKPLSVISIPVTDDSSPAGPRFKSEDELDAEIREAIRRSLLEVTVHPDTKADFSALYDSLYATSPFVQPSVEPTTTSMTHSYHPPPLNLDSQTEEGSATPRRLSGTSIPTLASSETSTQFESVHSPSTISRAVDTRSPTAQPDVFMAPVTAGDESDTFSDFHSLPSDDDMFDNMSEAESDFSMISGNLTPTDWTDVDTDVEGEEHTAHVATAQ